MRIRSIKPEFWRSDDITGLPISTRLTFIGLWSYVDDNGVGADKIVSIVADLYADDFSSDPQETLERVSADLQRLAGGGQVTRYRADHNGSAKDLLYVTKWKAHQKIQHPSLGHKYPLPPADLVKAAERLVSVSGESHESLTHEQGNRGTGEQGSEEPRNGGAGDEDPLPPEPPPGPYDEIVEAVVVEAPKHVDNPSKPSKRYPSTAALAVVRQELGSAGYPGTVMNRLAIQVENLHHEGHADVHIREALREWDQRPNCDKPEFLPTVYGDVVKKLRAVPAADNKPPHKMRVLADLAARTRAQEQANPDRKELA